MRETGPLFRSASIEWGTPPGLYAALEREFHFDFDPCPPGVVWDGKIVSWVGRRVFCNPPYGRGIGQWLRKGSEAALAVFLLPARTDTVWFHDYALQAAEIRFFKGRLRFNKGHVAPREGWLGNAAPFPSMLVIYRAVGLTGPQGTPLDLRAVEARLMAATPGPWEAGVTQVRAHIGDKEPIIALCANATARGYYGADVDFIARAPDDVAALLAHCRALRAALNEYLEEHWQERAPEVCMCGMCRRAAAVLAQGKDEP